MTSTDIGTDSPQTSGTVRGVLLLLAAVVVGLVVLSSAFDQDATEGNTPLGGGGEPEETSTTGASATGTARPPGEVIVLVLNAVDPRQPIAGTNVELLTASGYNALPPKDAPEVAASSAVYFVEGYEADAAQIATTLNLQSASVQPLPTPLPTAITDLSGAHVVAVIGVDSPTATTN